MVTFLATTVIGAIHLGIRWPFKRIGKQMEANPMSAQPTLRAASVGDQAERCQRQHRIRTPLAAGEDMLLHNIQYSAC